MNSKKKNHPKRTGLQTYYFGEIMNRKLNKHHVLGFVFSVSKASRFRTLPDLKLEQDSAFFFWLNYRGWIRKATRFEQSKSRKPVD